MAAFSAVCSWVSAFIASALEARSLLLARSASPRVALLDIAAESMICAALHRAPTDDSEPCDRSCDTARLAGCQTRTAQSATGG